MAESEDDEFNRGLILPPLLVQLKKILEQYPDDTQILKVSTDTYRAEKLSTFALMCDGVIFSSAQPLGNF